MQLSSLLYFLLVCMVGLPIYPCLQCLSRIRRIVWIRKSLGTTWTRAYLVQQCSEAARAATAIQEDIRPSLHAATRIHDGANPILVYYEQKI